MRHNKRASLTDIFLITVIGFAMVIISLFALKFLSVINTKMQATPMITAESKAMLNTFNSRMPKWIDGAFIMFWVCLMIVGLFLALQIQTNAVFLPISVIYFIFLIIITKIFSVIYNRMVSSAAMSAVGATLSIIPYMMDRLPVFTFVMGALIVALMVIKR